MSKRTVVDPCHLCKPSRIPKALRCAGCRYRDPSEVVKRALEIREKYLDPLSFRENCNRLRLREEFKLGK